MKRAIALSALLSIMCVFATAQQTGVHYPRVIRADVPFYPPAPWAARLGGTVQIEVTVENGEVAKAHVKRASVANGGDINSDNEKLTAYFSGPSLENVRTWRFSREVSTRFVVTYQYRIEGTQTESPENPTIVLDLPHSVSVTARPVKPTVTSRN